MPVAEMEIHVFIRTKDQSVVEQGFNQLIDSFIVRGIAVFDSSITTTMAAEVDDSEQAQVDILGPDVKL